MLNLEQTGILLQNELHVRISSAEEELQRFPPLLESMTDMKRSTCLGLLFCNALIAYCMIL